MPKAAESELWFPSVWAFLLSWGSLYPKSSAGEGGLDKMADQIRE